MALEHDVREGAPSQKVLSEALQWSLSKRLVKLIRTPIRSLKMRSASVVTTNALSVALCGRRGLPELAQQVGYVHVKGLWVITGIEYTLRSRARPLQDRMFG